MYIIKERTEIVNGIDHIQWKFPELENHSCSFILSSTHPFPSLGNHTEHQQSPTIVIRYYPT